MAEYTTPEPITREDIYYDFLINGGDAEKLPKPITRKEIYLNYLCQNGFGFGGGGEGGTTNYNALQNKPKINGTTLQGNLESEDIGITIPEYLPNPNPINFGGMLLNQTYDGSQAVNVVFPDVEILNETAGTPVGEIISYMGVTAPPNYLICDGTEYDIADYPYLAQHFIDNFGSANYFGGDGETTFAVPDLRGEFLRGSGTAARYTGSGEDVGLHQEGTLHCYFISHDDNGNIFYANSTNAVNYDKANIGYGTNIQGRNGSSGTEIIQTYTSRPTNTSVLYCIKYKPTYFATVGHTYSQEERRVGTWVDGKPLYEKTVDFGSLPNAETKQVPHGIEDVDVIWVHDGYALLAGNTYTLNHPGGGGVHDWNTIATPDTINIYTGFNRTDITAIITIRYTKTTD